jgi:hypothetical protein
MIDDTNSHYIARSARYYTNYSYFFSKVTPGREVPPKKNKNILCAAVPYSAKALRQKPPLNTIFFLPMCFCRGINHEVEKYFTFLIFIF